MDERGIDRRGFVVGSAVAATGLALFGSPLVAAAEDMTVLPEPGLWPYVELDPHQVGEWAATGIGGGPAGG